MGKRGYLGAVREKRRGAVWIAVLLGHFYRDWMKVKAEQTREWEGDRLEYIVKHSMSPSQPFLAEAE